MDPLGGGEADTLSLYLQQASQRAREPERNFAVVQEIPLQFDVVPLISLHTASAYLPELKPRPGLHSKSLACRSWIVVVRPAVLVGLPSYPPLSASDTAR